MPQPSTDWRAYIEAYARENPQSVTAVGELTPPAGCSGTIIDRFRSKIVAREDGCWIWVGHIDKAGYGRIQSGPRSGPVLYAHVLSYQMHRGEVPDGTELDHKCRVRCCVNPAHLEPVTHRENILRGNGTGKLCREGVCKRGHKVCPENTVLRKGTINVVYCKACRKEDRAAAGTISEAEFQNQVIQLFRAHGWRVAHFRKVRVRRKNGETYWETPVAADGKGFPDIEAVRTGRLVKIELKVGKNRLEPDQELWRDSYLAAGVEWYCFYPADWQTVLEVAR